MKDFFALSEPFVKSEYARHDPAHGWSHVEEVLEIAMLLASSYGSVDLDLLKLAVWFHDVTYDSYETHVDESLRTTEMFLRKHGYPEEKLTKLLDVIASHSGPHRRKLGPATYIEGKILYDADKFCLATTPEGFAKYFDRFYLDETRSLLEERFPELFE